MLSRVHLKTLRSQTGCIVRSRILTSGCGWAYQGANAFPMKSPAFLREPGVRTFPRDFHACQSDHGVAAEVRRGKSYIASRLCLLSSAAASTFLCNLSAKVPNYSGNRTVVKTRRKMSSNFKRSEPKPNDRRKLLCLT